MNKKCNDEQHSLTPVLVPLLLSPCVCFYVCNNIIMMIVMVVMMITIRRPSTASSTTTHGSNKNDECSIIGQSVIIIRGVCRV